MTATAPAESGLGRRLPDVALLQSCHRGHQPGWLRADVLDGVTVAAYLIPQVMAYAQVAGLPATTCLRAALVPIEEFEVPGLGVVHLWSTPHGRGDLVRLEQLGFHHWSNEHPPRAGAANVTEGGDRPPSSSRLRPGPICSSWAAMGSGRLRTAHPSGRQQ